MSEMDKTRKSPGDEVDLDALFADARDQQADPAPAFMARVLDQALSTQPVPASRTAPVRPSSLRQFLSAIGGWPAVAGLATAGVAGLWIGVNPPDTVVTTAETFLGTTADLYLVDVMPGYDFALAEG